MTRDYAKQSRPRRRPRWLTFIVVSGSLALFFSLILYLKNYLLHPHHKVISSPPPLPHPAVVFTKTQPRFDFYTLLPKMQVTSSKTDDSDSRPQNSHFPQKQGISKEKPAR
ncbi:hypothetical protein [Coxiella endosymbiont of Ornithodoros maritimus]|uniref:hypothetical protein n=1 Tax=Coxiella endosymbiont of Ornithodoros maritimus TaxID=1656172 RepID=UPI002264E86A|nr:hypothetical protein [Coxiella endosymbiont of Ornithodoros maritimus]